MSTPSVQRAPNRSPGQGNNGEIKPAAGLKGTDQPNSAGNQLGGGENSPFEMVFLQTLKDM
jgi:hypothetical protein